MVYIHRQLSARDYSYYDHCYGLMAWPELEEIGLPRLLRYPQLSLRGQGSLLAFIDTGIDLKSPLFLYEDGTTKVAFLWDQTDEAGAGPVPSGFNYGREWTGDEINRLLLRDTGADTGPDRPAGMSENGIPPQTSPQGLSGGMEEGMTGSRETGAALPGDEEGHGSFLAAIAAGREDGESGFSGVAPDSQLIVVKLRQADESLRDFYGIREGVWACREENLLSGLSYVISRAADLGRPVSVCIGVGSNLGGHDGSSRLERMIAELSLKTGVSVHIAGGNEEIAGHHVRGQVEEGKGWYSVDLNVAEGEKAFVMELWGQPPVRYTLSFTSPGGEDTGRLALRQGDRNELRFFPEETVLQVQSFLAESISGDQVIRVRFQDPAPGVWQLRIYAEEGLNAGGVYSGGRGEGTADFDIWLPISNFMQNETFFLNASVDETITSPGNARNAICYTPYDIRNDSLYLRAGRGYSRDGRVKPDLAAPGVGVTVPSSLPGGRPVSKSGSSLAAAFGAGIGALFGEWAIVKENDPTFNGQKLRALLIRGAVRNPAFTYPNREWGYGIINVYDAFMTLRG